MFAKILQGLETHLSVSSKLRGKLFWLIPFMFFDNVRVCIFVADFNLLGCEFITSRLHWDTETFYIPTKYNLQNTFAILLQFLLKSPLQFLWLLK